MESAEQTQFNDSAEVGPRALASAGRLTSDIGSATEAIISIDEQGRITSLNPAATRLFGYTPEEVVGEDIVLLISKPYYEEHDSILRDRNEIGVDEILGIGHEAVGRRKDGTEFPIDLAVGETHLGGRQSFTVLVRDIAERKRAVEALGRQTEELARSRAELERFAYVVSHDLQEPMRTVQGFAQLLQRSCGDTLTDDAAEFIKLIVNGVLRTQSLLNDLLAYSRVGSQGAAFAPADCNEICAKVLEDLKVSIEAHHAEVRVDPLPVVVGDAAQLGQVFQNLLDNAVKFHGDRKPLIHVSVSENPQEFVFSIADNGIGIAPEYFERIFIIFQRLHTIEEYVGTGAGLAICKKIVEHHGGRIWVESQAGVGATFYFLILKR